MSKEERYYFAYYDEKWLINEVTSLEDILEIIKECPESCTKYKLIHDVDYRFQGKIKFELDGLNFEFIKKDEKEWLN